MNTKTATATRKKKTRRTKSSAATQPHVGSIVNGRYQPARDEPYMSAAQLAHFRARLLAWKDDIIADIQATMTHLRNDGDSCADPNDRASLESEFALELRTRDRERKLMRKIDSALARIGDRSYGYCEETGDEIGLARLEIRPVATLCVEAQERRERSERNYADNR